MHTSGTEFILFSATLKCLDLFKFKDTCLLLIASFKKQDMIMDASVVKLAISFSTLDSCEGEDIKLTEVYLCEKKRKRFHAHNLHKVKNTQLGSTK